MLALMITGALVYATDVCPGSPSLIHAYTQIEALAQASCAVVRREVLSRIGSEGSGWHDPHNNGVYKVVDQSKKDILALQRTTGGAGKYTDKLNFGLRDAEGGCVIHGCSESQVFSISDFSTNYCNLRMLYCGSADGCHPVYSDFAVTERAVKPSPGAGADKAECLKV